MIEELQNTKRWSLIPQ